MDDAPITSGGIPLPPRPEHADDAGAVPAPRLPWAHWAPAPAGPAVPVLPPARGRRWPKLAAAVGVAAGTAVGAAVLAGAATGSGGPDVTTAQSSGSGTTSPPGSGPQSPDSSAGGGAGTPAPPGMPGGRGRMFFGGPGLPGGILHGQFTINGPNGYETLQMQNGTVRSITNTSGTTWSLVVTSADGTPLTYVVDSGTSIDGGETGVSSIATGDTVRVLAVVSGSTATAKQVEDQTVQQKNGQSWEPSRPTPPSSGSTSSSA